MAKGAGTRVAQTLYEVHCYKCDVRKQFQTERMKVKYLKLHTKFCDAKNGGGDYVMDYGNTQAREIVSTTDMSLFKN